ncbi:hypothetical protein ACH4FE_28180 [Streptomyces celluloflavus]|uniref:hypothetical protein n=1 Tax=Streptomyces celluloflavus TaxID=58344 RepID=UPI0037B90F8F
MYELSRVLMRGVGPKAARYEDVLLDFSGVGAPVASSRQGDIFDIGEPLRRPSPASVLFLENGGGKSVLLKLIFSVVLPGRREVVGTRNTRALEGFVQTGDVAHVVLEWTHAGSGKKLVTGKVSQWKSRRTSDESDLVERWYHFRPGLTVDLETLPIEENSQYLGLNEYGERLRLAAEREPALGYRSFQLHGEWTDRLMALGLDPELFRYQRAMNSDEGEAADAFSLNSDQAFVNFLLSAVLPLQPARDLASVLSTYAAKLADRGHMELEKTFVEEVLSVLAPLREARDARGAADGVAAEARTALDRFIRRVRARAEQEKKTLAERDQEVTRLKEEVRAAEKGHSHATAVVAELERRVAQLRLKEAEKRHDEADAEWRRATAVEKGWHAVPAVLRDLEATARARRLRECVAESEEAARPVLKARDGAAYALSRALRTMVCSLTDEASDLDERAAGYDREAAGAQKEHDCAVAAAAGGDATAAALEERAAEVQEALDAALREGLVPDGMAVADAAVRAESEAAANRERIAAGERAVEALEREHREATERSEALRSTLAEANHAYDLARRAFDDADTTMRALAEDLRHAGVYSGEAGDLHIEAADLADRLVRMQEDAEAARIDVRTAMAADERALTALEATDLLPSSVEAVRICDLLHEHRVSACTGWEYLASISDVERRRELVEAFPHLVTGVLVNDADHAELAAELLTAEDVTATSFVAMATTSALSGVGGLPPGASLVVPPHPALYDERAGEAERLELAIRREAHSGQLAELDRMLSTHAHFAVRLVQWRQTCPPGRLAEFHDARETAGELTRTARDAAAAAARSRDEKAGELSTARSRLPGLRDTQPGLQRRVEKLHGLVRSEERAAVWRCKAREARTGVREQRQAAAAAQGRAELARSAAADTRRTIDTMRAAATRAGEELAALPVRDTDGGAGAERTGAGQPLEVLRRVYRAAADEYSRVEVGADLRTQLDQAEQEAKAAHQALASFGGADRTMAGTLLAGLDGADATARDVGRARAQRLAEAACARRDTAVGAVARCRAACVALGEPPPGTEPVDLAPFGPPRAAAQGERLVAAAAQARSEAASFLAEFRRQLEGLFAEQGEARQTARGFKMLVDLFGEPSWSGPGSADDAPAYEGNVAGARERHDRLRGEHLTAQEAATEAETAERALADRLAAVVADTRFEELRSPSRRVMLGTARADLPGRADAWADDLRPRLRTLEIDLDSIDRHRTQIVLQFVQQVREALRTLKRAQRLSQLPEGLGSWSGQQFLQIGFPEVSEEVLAELLGRVVDQAAAEPTDRRGKRDARQLVLKGVEAAVEPKGFRVTVLKPDVGLAVERVRVAQAKDVFSGGQILTTAIVLYCTMAALRANDRGQVRRHRNSGVLFLDNPIGRASALYLLRLQQAVAKALGVQLVYTTGLYDKSALDVFPLVIRMRNDADLRARRRYLSVANRAVAGRIDALRNAPGGGDLAAVRYHERPSDVVAVQ